MNQKEIFKDSVFTKNEIEKLESQYLNFKDYFTLSIKVYTKYLFKVFLKPSLYITTTWFVLFVLLMINANIYFNYQYLETPITLLSYLFIVLAIFINFNFSYRSITILRNRSNAFLGKENSVYPYIFSLLFNLVLAFSINVLFSLLSVIPFVGFIIGQLLLLFSSLIFMNLDFMSVFENTSSVNNFSKSFELTYNRSTDVFKRCFMTSSVFFGTIVVVAINVFLIAFVTNISVSTLAPSIPNESFSSLMFVILSISIFLFFIFFSSISRAFNFVNYANLRLAPKINKSNEYYDKYKTMKFISIMFLISISIFVSALLVLALFMSLGITDNLIPVELDLLNTSEI